MARNASAPKFTSMRSSRLEALQRAEIAAMPATPNQIRQLQRLRRYGYTSQNCTRDRANDLIYDEMARRISDHM
jgi:hypothetical protein